LGHVYADFADSRACAFIALAIDTEHLHWIGTRFKVTDNIYLAATIQSTLQYHDDPAKLSFEQLIHITIANYG